MKCINYRAGHFLWAFIPEINNREFPPGFLKTAFMPGGYRAGTFALTVPADCTDAEIEAVLKDTHKTLSEEEDGIYAKDGIKAATLLDYVCERHPWEWGLVKADLNLIFE